MSSTAHRRKLSTTISQESYAFLQTLVKSGKAASMAEAVDITAQAAQRAQNRARLEQDTAIYFQRLSARATAQESELENALGQMADEVDFGS